MDIHGVSLMNDGNRMVYSLMAGSNQWYHEKFECGTLYACFFIFIACSCLTGSSNY